jgi:hypothetical protein
MYGESMMTHAMVFTGVNLTVSTVSLLCRNKYPENNVGWHCSWLGDRIPHGLIVNYCQLEALAFKIQKLKQVYFLTWEDFRLKLHIHVPICSSKIHHVGKKKYRQ